MVCTSLLIIAYLCSQKLHGRPRPFFKAKDGTIKIHRTLPEHTPCAICGTTQTPIWRKGPDNTVICNGCSLISKQTRALDFSHGIEAQPFPSPPQSAHSGSAVYTLNKKTRQRSRGKASLRTTTTLHQKNGRDGGGTHGRSGPKNYAISDVEARKKRDEAVLEFYSGYNSGIGPGGAEVDSGNPHGGPQHCSVHGSYSSCSCTQYYFGLSGGPCDGRPGQPGIVSTTADTLSTVPPEATISQ
ncbi:hypothetical protein EC968_004833 [Mortierella alpina]|nr:hypothetical protein EC968_004833 [Mortierella alpina]